MWGWFGSEPTPHAYNDEESLIITWCRLLDAQALAEGIFHGLLIRVRWLVILVGIRLLDKPNWLAE